jgi:hypothetical protein
MPLTYQRPSAGPKPIDSIPNDEEDTITFVADLHSDTTVPPTEWITVTNQTVIDLRARR